MTIRQMMESVAALSSQTLEGRESVFCAALNRALDEIGHAFPKTTVERLYHVPPTPSYASATITTVTPEAPLRIVANLAYAFALTAYGEGSVSVLLDGSSVAEYTVSHNQPLSLALKVSELSDTKTYATLVLFFRSTSRLYLDSVAVYDSEQTTVMPYSEYCCYPVSGFSHRFLSFDGKILRNGKALSGGNTTIFEEDAIKLRTKADGIYEVYYKALPDLVSEDNLDDALFLREDALALVPLLTSYYVALEDENPTADAFLSRYEVLKGHVMQEKGETVGDVYGW